MKRSVRSTCAATSASVIIRHSSSGSLRSSASLVQDWDIPTRISNTALSMVRRMAISRLPHRVDRPQAGQEEADQCSMLLVASWTGIKSIYKCTGSTARYTPIDSSQFGMLVQVIVVHGFVI
jgi:hypothetical protein